MFSVSFYMFFPMPEIKRRIIIIKKNKLLGILKNVDYFIFSASYLAMQHLHIATHGVLSDWL